jgi:hypothetical protein
MPRRIRALWLESAVTIILSGVTAPPIQTPTNTCGRFNRFDCSTQVGFVHSASSTVEAPVERQLELLAGEALAAVLRRRSQKKDYIHRLALQWPWGEWSDRRTELESMMAERHHSGVRGAPKPNVARTLFALEVIAEVPAVRLDRARNLALSWITSNIVDGWFWEWTAGQSEHSETSFPEALKRADVRHTAQAVTAMVKWQKGRERLVDCSRSLLVRNLKTAIGQIIETVNSPAL